MTSLQLIREAFPKLPASVLAQLEEHARLFRIWNAKINLVSRKDIEAFEEHHLLHSLAAAKTCPFAPGTRVLDVGTGGGLPGLPLAILFPQARFYLLDSIQKKIRAVEAMAHELALENVICVHKRAERLESKWDYVLGRAVASLPKFLPWIVKNLNPGGPKDRPNGVLYWKGSLYREELAELGTEPFRVTDLEDLYQRPYFHEKYLIHLRASSLRSLPRGRPNQS